MKRRMFVLVIVVLLAGMLIGAAVAPYTTIVLKANQSVMANCQGDEFIITPYGDTEVEITCRVWLGRGE